MASLGMSVEDAKTDYTFDGRGGQCNICPGQVHFTSVNTAKDHILGVKHQKALSKFKGRVLGPDYLLSTTSAIESPKADVSHQDLKYFNTALDVSLSGLSLETDGSSSIQSNIDPCVSLNVDGSGYCLCCNASLTSKKAMDEHIVGKQHIKQKKLKTTPPKPPSLPFSRREREHDDVQCFLCGVTFTSDITRDQHLNGEKHLKKKRKIEDGNGEYLVGDNTQWFRCNTCNVSVNSEDQLQKHCQGQRHLVNMAKQKGTPVVGEGRPSSQSCTQEYQLFPHSQGLMPEGAYSMVSVENPSDMSSLSTGVGTHSFPSISKKYYAPSRLTNTNELSSAASHYSTGESISVPSLHSVTPNSLLDRSFQPM